MSQSSVIGFVLLTTRFVASEPHNYAIIVDITSRLLKLLYRNRSQTDFPDNDSVY